MCISFKLLRTETEPAPYLWTLEQDLSGALKCESQEKNDWLSLISPPATESLHRASHTQDERRDSDQIEPASDRLL